MIMPATRLNFARIVERIIDEAGDNRQQLAELAASLRKKASEIDDRIKGIEPEKSEPKQFYQTEKKSRDKLTLAHLIASIKSEANKGDTEFVIYMRDALRRAVSELDETLKYMP